MWHDAPGAVAPPASTTADRLSDLQSCKASTKTDLENLMLRLFINAAVAGAIALSMPTQAIARDPGVNQPGRAGNTGVGRDPGINQPGAAGNVGVGAPRAGVRDPGINQPGAAGNTSPGNRGGPVNRAGRR